MTAPMGTVPTWLMQNSFSAICPYGSLNAPITDFELDRINESPEADGQTERNVRWSSTATA